MSGAEGKRLGEIAAFCALLDSHGADRTRWPAPARLRFAPLLAESAEARQLLAEASALDRLLDLAPVPEAGVTEALASRIAAAAAREPVVAPARDVLRPAASLRAIQARHRTEGASWQAAMLLAASLVLGIFAGTSSWMEDAVAPLIGVASAEDVELDLSQVGLDGDSATVFEEGLL